ncbi:MAG: hypothetical protein LC808_07970, partial [Actinobacteria bacterium]|nr:hypothetical protein [Actinomycetota bacterium]
GAWPMTGMTALSDGTGTSARPERHGDHRDACPPGSSGVAPHDSPRRRGRDRPVGVRQRQC